MWRRAALLWRLHAGGRGLHLPPEPYRHQRASGVALAAEALALAGGPATAAELVPNYLRLSQAERERLARLQQEKGANK